MPLGKQGRKHVGDGLLLPDAIERTAEVGVGLLSIYFWVGGGGVGVRGVRYRIGALP